MALELLEKLPKEKDKSRMAKFLCSFCGRTFVATIGNTVRRKTDDCGCQIKPKKEAKPRAVSSKKSLGNKPTPYEEVINSGIQKDVQYVPQFNKVSTAIMTKIPKFPFWVTLRNGQEVDRQSMSGPDRFKYQNQVRHIRVEDFDRKVNVKGLVAVYFHREDCEGCAAMLPDYEAFHTKRPDLKFFALKRPAGVPLFELFNLKVYPTVIVYKDGREFCRNETFTRSSTLIEWLKEVEKYES